MYPVSLCFLCAAHILHCLAGFFFFPSPPPTIFFKPVYSEITRESACWVLFRPPSLVTEGHQNLTQFDSGLLISRTSLPCAGSSCTLLCLYLLSYTQKNTLKSTQFSRPALSTPFMNLLYWPTAYGFFISTFFFMSFLPLFTIVASWIVLIIRTSCPSTFTPLRHHSSGMLTSRFSSFPLLGHVECPC